MKGEHVEVAVGPPVVSAHFDDEVVVCELSGEMSSRREQGYFAADTRLVSGYRLKLGGERPILLDGAATGHHSARFEFANPALVGCDGHHLPGRSLHLRLDRTVGPGVHEDYDVTNQGRDDVVLDISPDNSQTRTSSSKCVDTTGGPTATSTRSSSSLASGCVELLVRTFDSRIGGPSEEIDHREGAVGSWRKAVVLAMGVDEEVGEPDVLVR